MIKKLFKKLFLIILIIFIIGLVTALIDYMRMSSGKVPMFNVSSYDSVKKKQTFKGLVYTASRRVRASDSESISDSSKLKFKILTFALEVPDQRINEEIEYTFKIEKSKECSKSVLYYADLNIKIYTYCLDNILLNNKELSSYFSKNANILDDVDSKLEYTGLYTDKSTMMFKNDTIRMYRCHKSNINDVYIGPVDMSFQEDFCTTKDDDFKFIFEIEEDTEGVDIKDEKEVFYEDEKYKYQFDKVKSDYVFITTPEVRGKAATKRSLKEVLNNNLLTIDELEKKGLVFEKIDKSKEVKESQ